MVSRSTVWANLRTRGFLTVALFYLLGLGGTVALAQFMPVATICNPGLAFITGLFSLIIGASLAVVTLLMFLMGRRGDFIKSSLLAHLLVFGGVFLLLVGLNFYS